MNDLHGIKDGFGPAGERLRVLKHGDTFALFDQHGDIRPGENGEGGLYHDGTRFLSRFHMDLDGARPFLLSSTVRDDNDQLSVGLTNPDLRWEGRPYLPISRTSTKCAAKRERGGGRIWSRNGPIAKRHSAIAASMAWCGAACSS